MVELLLRLETLLLELNPSTLLSVGAPVLLVGLILWLSGDRFGGAIIGLLGGAVGAAGGLFHAVGEQANLVSLSEPMGHGIRELRKAFISERRKRLRYSPFTVHLVPADSLTFTFPGQG